MIDVSTVTETKSLIVPYYYYFSQLNLLNTGNDFQLFAKKL